jgi:exopolyphosphatase/guanosine-5'-triphosphate,3'-diphosphate pyrophosphatase
MLIDAFAPDTTEEARELLAHAATVLDIGRSVDYYERHRHAAEVILAADIAGFSHAHVAFMASVLRQAAGERPSKAFRPLLTKEERSAISMSGVALAIADEIERRTPPGSVLELECRIEGRSAVVTAPVLSAWPPREMTDRFLGAFHRRLVLEGRAP